MNDDTMEITLYPLGDYNDGILRPFTIDLGEVNSQEDYQKAVNKGLWEKSLSGNVLSIHCPDCGYVGIAETLEDVGSFCPTCGMGHLQQKETNEEWIVCHSEGVPKDCVGEYDLDIVKFLEYKEALDASGIDKDAFDAGVALGIPPESVQEAYCGSYDTDEDFAQDMAESLCCLRENDKWPYTCIDWERAAHELMFDFYEQEGHYFSLNY